MLSKSVFVFLLQVGIVFLIQRQNSSEKSTDSVQGQLFQEKSQPSQERQSIFLENKVNDFST